MKIISTTIDRRKLFSKYFWLLSILNIYCVMDVFVLFKVFVNVFLWVKGADSIRLFYFLLPFIQEMEMFVFALCFVLTQ